MSVSNSIIAPALFGAIVGAVGGALPLIAGLCWREYKKAFIGFSLCVLFGAIFGGGTAVAPAVGSFLSIVLAQQQRISTAGPSGLVFKYLPGFAWFTITLGILLTFFAAFLLTGAGDFALDGKSSGVVFMVVLSTVFGWLGVKSARNGFAMLSEYGVSAEGITVTRRARTKFMPWNDLVDAKHGRAFRELILTFNDFPRRVLLTDLSPDSKAISKAVALVERATGRAVSKSFF